MKTLKLTNQGNQKFIRLQSFISQLQNASPMNQDSYSTQEFNEDLTFHRILPNSLNQSAISTDIKKIQTMTSFQTLLSKRQLLYLSAAFQQADLPMLCLKGPVILEKAYAGQANRIMRDLDLLVHPARLEEAASLLLQQGYVTEHDLGDIEFRKKENHYVFVHKDNRHVVELHWRLFPNILEEPDFHLLWDTRGSIQLGEQSVYCLNNEILFAYLIIHGAKHGWFRLKWLFDIHQFLKLPLDWSQVSALTDAWEIQHMMGQAMTLVQELFHQDVPRELQPYMHSSKSKRMTRDALKMMSEKLDAEQMSLHFKNYLIWKKYYFLIRSPEKKKQFFLYHFIPTQHDREVLPLPKSLHALYIPLRPLTVLMRRYQTKRGHVS